MPIADITIRYLELTPATFAPKRASRAGVTFTRVDPPMPELNRFLYMSIGGPWYWLERRVWSHEQWCGHFSSADRIETHVLSVDGIPAGFVELQRRDGGAVEIDYLGMHRAFIGQGLGAHLLTCAVERALAMGATKVILNTCNLDHPTALANYVARGFREVRSEVRQKELPESAPGPWDESRAHDVARALLRHAVAVVAYRGSKAIRGAPESFRSFRPGPESRAPIEIVAHIGDLYDWALGLAQGAHKWRDSAPLAWDDEVARFHRTLAAFDDHLASGAALHWSPERLLAGPVADSLTHVGQLTMLRRLAGSPVKGENYAKADIAAGRVGAEQHAPPAEFG